MTKHHLVGAPRSEIDDCAGADIAEGVEAAFEGAAGQLAVMLAVFEPERHGRLVDLLRHAEADTRERA